MVLTVKKRRKREIRVQEESSFFFEWFLCGALAFAVFIGSYVPIYYGIHFTDEAYYVAMPYAFTLGAKPFVNELGVFQNAALLLIPWAKLFLLMKGSAEGIILYFRHLFFLFNFLLSVLVFSFLKRFLLKTQALCVACVSMSFVPLWTSSLSYNTLAYLGCCSGFILFSFAIVSKKKAVFAALGSFAFCIAAFSYPTLAPVLSVSLVWFCLRLYKISGVKELKIVFGLVLTIFLFSLVSVGFLLHQIGSERILELIDFYRSVGIQMGGLTKIQFIFDKFVRVWQMDPSMGMVWVVLLASFLFSRFLGLFPILLIPFVLWSLLKLESNSVFMMHLCFNFLLGGFLIFKKRSMVQEEKILFFMWWVSLVVGAVCAWTSANGIGNSQLGTVPATLALLGILFSDSTRNPSESKKSRTLFVLGISFILVQMIGNYRFFYLEGSFDQLKYRIESGPFKGIYTNARKKNFMEVLERDAFEFAKNHSSVLFYDEFPAGYLFSRMRPETPGLWIPDQGRWFEYDRRFFSRYFEKENHLPEVVFHFRSFPIDNDEIVQFKEDQKDPLEKWLRTFYQRVLNREHYEVYALMKKS